MARKILPKFFSQIELKNLLHSRFPVKPAGRRDQAILETLVATGLRSSELLALLWRDLTPDLVFVRRGKGGKQRYVPLSDRAWRALSAIRPKAAGPGDAVFLNAWGDPLSRRGLHKIVKGYIRAAGLDGSAHTIRHGLATRLLNNGMPLRSVQAVLGHSFLSTTAVYLHVSTALLCSQYRSASALGL